MKVRIFSLAAFAFATYTFASSTLRAQPQVTPSQDLSARVAELEKTVEDLRQFIITVRTRQGVRYATLDCNSGQYSEVQTSSGSLIFFVSCAKIEPYLEGHKVTLNIGNLYAADFRNASLRLSHGTDFNDRREAQVKFSDRLPAGQWTPVVITVNPSKSEQFRHVAVEIDVETAVLGVPK